MCAVVVCAVVGPHSLASNKSQCTELSAMPCKTSNLFCNVSRLSCNEELEEFKNSCLQFVMPGKTLPEDDIPTLEGAALHAFAFFRIAMMRVPRLCLDDKANGSFVLSERTWAYVLPSRLWLNVLKKRNHDNAVFLLADNSFCMYLLSFRVDQTDLEVTTQANGAPTPKLTRFCLCFVSTSNFSVLKIFSIFC